MGRVDTVYLVRHAKAGERRLWNGDDIDRPLSKKGWKQSRAVAERLARKGATTLYSSRYVRCVQTLEPLAELIGQPVRVEPRLLEHEPFEPVLDLLAEVPDGSVLCTHGDIVPAVVQALHRRGMTVDTPADWGKSSTWVLRRKRGRITRGKVWPPPL
ncbi:SixA phosphatase family protein [Ilumatobacter sp.]|uniref:SixA phosphatase family protein n=1 Tax=Ilumatobacter sp. TaxID=1967498 RepID=UPI003B517247